MLVHVFEPEPHVFTPFYSRQWQHHAEALVVAHHVEQVRLP